MTVTAVSEALLDRPRSVVVIDRPGGSALKDWLCSNAAAVPAGRREPFAVPTATGAFAIYDASVDLACF